MNTILAAIISGILSMITGIIASIISYSAAKRKARIDIESEIKKTQQEIYFHQKHKLFLPFKYHAREFHDRISHIKKRLLKEDDQLNKDMLTEKYYNMCKRLNQNFSKKQLTWYFDNDIEHGGYYITSTIYLHCMFFHWLYRILIEYPYMPLSIEKESMEEFTIKYKKKEHLCLPDNTIRVITIQEKKNDFSLRKKLKLYTFIKEIKYILSGAHGIPYGIMDSIGDFMYNNTNKKAFNYEEFCIEIEDKQKQLKFIPIIKFWQNLTDKDHNRIDIIKHLQTILHLLDLYEIEN